MDADAPLTPGSPAWWEARRTRPRRSSALTAERIVDAAIDLLDSQGLDAFTMRRLAQWLDTAPGSLYRHFESRDAVLVAVHDHLIGAELDTAANSGTGVGALADLPRRQYRLLRRRPYLASVWRTTEQLGPNALRAREHALQLILDTGLSPQSAARVYLTLLHYTIAFADMRHALQRRTPQQRQATRRYFATLDEREFSAVRGLARELVEVDVDDEFELGLQAVLEHISRLIDQQSPT